MQVEGELSVDSKNFAFIVCVFCVRRCCFFLHTADPLLMEWLALHMVRVLMGFGAFAVTCIAAVGA